LIIFAKIFARLHRFDFADFRRLKNVGKERRGNVLKLVLSLLEEGIDNVLLHIFFSFFQPVAFAFDVDDGAVMKHTARIAEANAHICKDLVSLGKGLVGGKYCRDLLIPYGNELKNRFAP